MVINATHRNISEE